MISQEIIDLVESIKDIATKGELEFCKKEVDEAIRNKKPRNIDYKEVLQSIKISCMGKITAKLDDIYEETSISRERFEEVINDLEKDGTIYSPKRGFIQLL